MNLELFDLRLFIHIAEESSFTKGARRSCLSLPAASARIKHLEQSTGSRLLTRTSHGVYLTSAGRALLRHARRIVQQMEHLSCDLGEYAEHTQSRVRLMATTVAISGRLPARIGAFVMEQPHALVDIGEQRSSDIVIALQDGRADIGIVNATAITDDLVQFPFSREKLVMAVPASHRFAKRSAVSFEESLSERHIATMAGSSLASVLLETATAAGREGAFSTRVSSFESMCRLVEAGIGLGVLAQSSAMRYGASQGIVFVPMSDEWADFTLKLVACRDVELPRLASDLFDYLQIDTELVPPGTAELCGIT